MKTMTRSLALGLALLLGTVAFASETPAPTAKTVEDGNTWTTAADGKTFFTCPVCDMIHTMDEAKAATVVQGRKYYLCHPNEQVKLRAGAATYLGERFFVPGNLQTWSKSAATFKDPVNGEVAPLTGDTPSQMVGHVRYFFVSEETKAAFEPESATLSGS